MMRVFDNRQNISSQRSIKVLSGRWSRPDSIHLDRIAGENWLLTVFGIQLDYGYRDVVERKIAYRSRNTLTYLRTYFIYLLTYVHTYLLACLVSFLCKPDSLVLLPFYNRHGHLRYTLVVVQVKVCYNAFIALSPTAGSFSPPYYELMLNRKKNDHYPSGYDNAIR